METETERRVILEKNGDYYRVIGAEFKGEIIDYVQDILESKSLEIALSHFYRLNPNQTSVLVTDNTK